MWSRTTKYVDTPNHYSTCMQLHCNNVCMKIFFYGNCICDLYAKFCAIELLYVQLQQHFTPKCRSDVRFKSTSVFYHFVSLSPASLFRYSLCLCVNQVMYNSCCVAFIYATCTAYACKTSICL